MPPDTAAPNVLLRGALALGYRDTGGEGLPVVFQHGLCADVGQSFALLPDRPDLRRIALDCRGHGTSDLGSERDLSLAAFAGDVAALVEGRVGVRAVLGGTSMGAAVALRLAVRHPDLTRALVLVRPAWTTRRAPPNLRAYAEAGRLLGRGTPEAARRAFEAGATAAALAAEAPEVLDGLLALFGRSPARSTAALLRRIPVDGPDVSVDDLARLRVPALVIGQPGDPLHPASHAEALARLIPGAHHLVLPAGFGRTARRPAVRAAIDAFLRERVAGAGPGP